MKEKPQKKKVGSIQPVNFIIQDEINIFNESLKLLLPHMNIKLRLTTYLGRQMLTYFEGRSNGLAVVSDISRYEN